MKNKSDQPTDDIEGEYDFSHGKRGAVIERAGKTQITIWVDTEVLNAFRDMAEAKGCGYQTAMNSALRSAMDSNKTTLEERIES